jgi:hypothetical protein
LAANRGKFGYAIFNLDDEQCRELASAPNLWNKRTSVARFALWESNSRTQQDFHGVPLFRMWLQEIPFGEEACLAFSPNISIDNKTSA